MDVSKDPVEGKVWGSTIGSGSGAIVSAFVLWVLGITVWGASASAANATEAVAAVPLPVAGFVGLILTVGGTFVGGYVVKHTPRLVEDFLDDEVVEDDEQPQPRFVQTVETQTTTTEEPKSYKA